MVGGQGGGTFQGHSDALKETEGLFVEGRACNSVDPERIGVGLSRPPERKDGSELSTRWRHWVRAGKSV